jgi:hypothetical protein
LMASTRDHLHRYWLPVELRAHSWAACRVGAAHGG